MASEARGGVFVNPALPGLYTDLVARGEKGLVEALKVGADIEGLDIADIRTRLGNIPPKDVVAVYQKLMKAPRNHLSLFVGELTSREETYAPTYLSPVECEAIVSTPSE